MGYRITERLARIAWSKLTEPEDNKAHSLCESIGHQSAWELINRAENIPSSLREYEKSIARWRERIKYVDPEQHLRQIKILGGTVLIPSDPQWPKQLDDLSLVPHCLWVRGNLETLYRPPISLVGARASSDYGKIIAKEFSFDLAERGFSLVSGGAYGIDIEVHRGAILAKGKTVAIIAGGVDRYYPLRHANEFGQIINTGIIISELPPGSEPTRYRFIARNRIIAALGLVTVVIEAAARSGALLTARLAEELSRPVMAVPGSIFSHSSEGCHSLIKLGAMVVTSVDDILGFIPSDCYMHNFETQNAQPYTTSHMKEARNLIERDDSQTPLINLPTEQRDISKNKIRVCSMPEQRENSEKSCAGRENYTRKNVAYDDLAEDIDELSRRLLDVIPNSRGVTLDQILLASGVDTENLATQLAFLEATGRVLRNSDGWIRAR